MKILETQRLALRTWEPHDLEAFYQLNQDPRVLEFFPGPWSKEACQDFMQRMNEEQEKLGFCLWAVEEKASGSFIGFVGLNSPPWEAHFTPCVEIGWRLAAEAWGKGYATEAAQTALAYGFDKIGLKEIVSFTVPANQRSRRVMEKIGMSHDPSDDFLHPQLPVDHPLAKHVLYRIRKP